MENSNKIFYKITFNVKAIKSVIVHIPEHILNSQENIEYYLDTHASSFYLENELFESEPEPDFNNIKIQALTKDEYENCRCFEISEVKLNVKEIPNSFDYETMCRVYPECISVD